MGVSDYKNWISDFRLQSSDYKTRFQITKIGFQISDYKNQISNVKSRFLAMADFRFQITKSHEITKSAMRLQEPHFKSPWNLHCMRRANFRFHISDFKSALTRFLKLAEFWFQITKRCNGALEIFRQISDFRFQISRFNRVLEKNPCRLQKRDFRLQNARNVAIWDPTDFRFQTGRLQLGKWNVHYSEQHLLREHSFLLWGSLGP